MKRSSSEPNLSKLIDNTKKARVIKETNTKEYLQLALKKILEMQKQIQEESTLDNLSDHGDSENEEDTFKEVLIQIFKDLPGSSQSTVSIIENAMKLRDPRLDAIRSKSIQLAGYDTCRKVALEFMKNVVKCSSTSTPPNNRNDTEITNRTQAGSLPTVNCEINAYRKSTLRNSSSHYEIRMRMLKSLDLHLAVKQRDYIAELMRQ